MLAEGYYEFEGNTLIYEGGDEVYDIDSGTYYPVYILDVAEYIGVQIKKEEMK